MINKLEITALMLLNVAAHIIMIYVYDASFPHTKYIEKTKIVPHYVSNTDTVNIIDTVFINQADSKFFKAILEIETRAITKLAKGDTSFTMSIGDGGKGKGALGIHQIATEGTTRILGYTHNDMFNLEKASHVFWVKMGVYAYKYKQEYGELPTYEQLARMWNGSYSGIKKESTKGYARKFNTIINSL